MTTDHRELFVGVDLGGTKIIALLADATGQVYRRHYWPTEAEAGPQAVIAHLVEAIRQARGNQPVSGIGLGAAGLCTRDGVVTTSPNLSGWHNVPLRDIIQREFHIPTYVDNDANAAALGEYYFGVGRGARNLLYVTLSTGIGGGIIVEGHLVTGATGTAGEVGHMIVNPSGPQCSCGRYGCWEALASGTAIARWATARLRAGEESSLRNLDPTQVTAEAVAAAARQGDALAQRVVRRTSHYLAIGLVNLVHIFNPELIILGGGVSQIGEPLIGPARQSLMEQAFEAPVRAVRILIAQLGQDAGALGAVALVLHQRGLAPEPAP